MTDTKRSAGRAKKLFTAFYTVRDADGDVVNVNGYTDAKRISDTFEGSEVIEKRVYGSFEDYAYDQNQPTARKLLGNAFNEGIWERQYRAKAKEEEESGFSTLPPEERIRRKAVAKLAKTLSNEELAAIFSKEDLAALGVSSEVKANTNNEPANVVTLPVAPRPASESLQSVLDKIKAGVEEEETEEEAAALDEALDTGRWGGAGEDDENDENDDDAVQVADTDPENENENEDDGSVTNPEIGF